MPHRLNTLYTSLVLAITEYCDTKMGTSCIVGEPEPDLDELIDSAMSTNSVDGTDRTSLMRYVLYVVNQLKPLVEQEIVLDEEKAINLQEELIQFVLDIQLALTKSKSTQITVHYDDQDHALFGCSLMIMPCKSGGIIQRHLFEALNLPVNVCKEDITEYFKNAINAHQCPLLRRERERLQALTKELMMAPLLEEPHFQTPALLSAQEEIERLRELLLAAHQQVNDLIKPSFRSSFARGFHGLFTPGGKPVESKDLRELAQDGPPPFFYADH